MASMTYSVWAKLMMSMTPQIIQAEGDQRVHQPHHETIHGGAEEQAHERLRDRRAARQGGRGGRGTSALGPGGSRPHDGRFREIEGPDDLVLASEELLHDTGRVDVLPVLVELDPFPGHDGLVPGDVDR